MYPRLRLVRSSGWLLHQGCKSSDSFTRILQHAHHSEHADHSDGDLEGMRIRHPGYFSIVVPNYGAQVPSFQRGHCPDVDPGGFPGGRPADQTL